MMADIDTPHSVLAHLSPAQAAQAVSVSRWAIMRAIKSHELSAIRDNKNHWKIDPAELDRWSASTVRTVEAENDQLRERLSEIKEDRDAWREMGAITESW